MATGMMQMSGSVTNFGNAAQTATPHIRSANAAMRDLQRSAGDTGRSLGAMGASMKQGLAGMPQMALSLWDAAAGLKGMATALETVAPSARVAVLALGGISLGVVAVGLAVAAYSISVFRFAKEMDQLGKTARSMGVSFASLKDAQDQAKASGRSAESVVRSFQGIQAAQLDLYKNNSQLRQKLLGQGVDANWIGQLATSDPRAARAMIARYGKALERQALDAGVGANVAAGIMNQFYREFGQNPDDMELALKPLDPKREAELKRIEELSKSVSDVWGEISLKLDRLEFSALSVGLPVLIGTLRLVDVSLGAVNKIIDFASAGLDKLGVSFVTIMKLIPGLGPAIMMMELLYKFGGGGKSSSSSSDIEPSPQSYGGGDNDNASPVQRISFSTGELAEQTGRNADQTGKLTGQLEKLNSFFDRVEGRTGSGGSGGFQNASFGGSSGAASGGGYSGGGGSYGGASGGYSGGGNSSSGRSSGGGRRSSGAETTAGAVAGAQGTTKGVTPEGMALMDTIATREAEPAFKNGQRAGWNTGVGGKTLDVSKPPVNAAGAKYSYKGSSIDIGGVEQHPHHQYPGWGGFQGGAGTSFAFGRYQETVYTYYENVKRSQKLHPGMKVDGWTPEAQNIRNWDKAQEVYSKGYQKLGMPGLTGNLQKDLEANKGNPAAIGRMSRTLSGEWTSAPGGSEGAKQTGGKEAYYGTTYEKMLEQTSKDPALASKENSTAVTSTDPSQVIQQGKVEGAGGGYGGKYVGDGGTKGTDPRLHAAVVGGASYLPEGYTVRQTSGFRGGNNQSYHGKHAAGDFQIYDPDGHPIPNEGEDKTGMYTRLARGVKTWALKNDPKLVPQIGYGGAFGTKLGGGGVPDLMHYDLGGSRGRMRPEVQFGNLQPLPDNPVVNRGALTADKASVNTEGSLKTQVITKPGVTAKVTVEGSGAFAKTETERSSVGPSVSESAKQYMATN